MRNSIDRSALTALPGVLTVLTGVGCAKNTEAEATSAQSEGEIAGTLSFATWRHP